MSVKITGLDCELPIPDPKLQRTKDTFTPEELDEVDRRINLLASRLAASRQLSEGAEELASQEAYNLAITRWANADRLSNINTLNPELSTRSIPYMLARDWAVVLDAFGFGEKLTKPGEVRQFFNRAKKLWEGGVHEALAKLETIEVSADAERRIGFLKGKYGIPKNEWDVLKSLAVEIGHHPFIQEYTGLGASGIKVLQGRQERLLTKLQNYGFSEDDIDFFIEQAGRVANTYHEVLSVAQRAGIDVGAIANMNYFPRVFSQEALRRFDWAQQGEKVIFSDGTVKSLAATFTKARNSYNFVVEDEVLLDYLLRAKDPDIYKNLSKQFGQQIDSVRDLFDDWKVIGEALFNTLGTEELDRLVDSGIFSKIPMTSEEIFKHLVDRYKLPFDGISELMATDWAQASKLYKDQLENLAGRSGMTWTMVRNAVENGWGVTATEVASDPTRYKGFVPLADAIPPQMKNRFGIKPVQGVAGMEDMNNVYVHPVVSGLYNAMLETAISPAKMGVVGQLVKSVNDVFRTLAVSTTGFVSRELINKVFQIGAAGGNIADYAPTLMKLLVANKFGIDKVLDDTRKIYKGFNGALISERELYHQAVEQGLVNAYTIMAGAKVGTTYHAWNPLTVKRTAKYLSNTISEYKDWTKLVEEAGGMFKHAVTDWAGYPFRVMHNQFENAAKFSTLKSLVVTNTFERPGVFIEKARAALNDSAKVMLSGGQFQSMTLPEAVHHINKYFFDYADLGNMDKVMNTFVVPFWGYRSRNMLSQFRHAIRNPHTFVSYNKLYAAMNAPVADDGDDLPEGGVPKHILNDKPIYWRMPDGEYFAIPMTPIDPIMDAWNTTEITVNEVLRNLGIWKQGTKPRSPEGQLDTLPWKDTQTNSWLSQWLKDTYPVYQGIASTLTKEDIRTGKPLEEDESGRRVTSFLGVRMHPLTRYWMETLVPTLGQINRANPGAVFGLRPRFDSKTGQQISEGKLSIFGAERSDFDRQNDEASKYKWMVGLRELGFNPTQIDVAFNMGYREDAVKYALKDGKLAIVKLRNNVRTIQDPKRQKEAVEQLEYMKAAWVLLRADYQKLYRWRTERGLSPRAAIRKLQDEQMTVHQLPLPDEDYRDIIKELSE